MALTDDKFKSTYITKTDGASHDYPYTGRRYKEGDYISLTPAPAEPFTGVEGAYTDPNLHRRIDNKRSDADAKIPPEVDYREYTLMIQNVNSYRTTEFKYHDENSTTSEIP